MEAMVLEITGIKVLSLHHDISTVTGEEVVIFTLAESPQFRKSRRSRTPDSWSGEGMSGDSILWWRDLMR
jgi:Na+-translocating membrane potential-generating system (MpsC)